jgi:membrane fusion protein, multidrug efflux system
MQAVCSRQCIDGFNSGKWWAMTRRILLAVFGLLILIGFLGGVKVLQVRKMMAQGSEFAMPPETVTVAAVQAGQWESVYTAVGSLEAVQGITVTAELTGKVVNVAFESGRRVKAGEVLVQQDTSAEQAQLRAAEAAAALAEVNFERAKKLLPQRVGSQSDYDRSEAEFKQAAAQRDNIRTMIAKKTLRAPFGGRLGIRGVNLGQVLNSGDPIVSLQALDPILVNFLLPQQRLAAVGEGFRVRVTSDALTDQVIEGEITAIDPQIDSATRNVRLQATVANPEERLRPGMFVHVAVVLPAMQEVLAIPATAVQYAPYGNSVFVLQEVQDGPSGMVVRQQVVELGEKRGDFVAVRSGLREGDVVVSTGVFKLRNGQAVVVDNTLSPEFKLSPSPQES